jgi:hypothetical protein|tara:strand:- start:237 stop:635 length:399 start_codon:yes stop_codon:yes gene_type:complete
MDDLDDLMNSIIDPKPQPENAEAFSTGNPENQEKDNKDENSIKVKNVSKDWKYGTAEDPVVYRRVRKIPYVRKWPTCGLCKKKITGDRFGWFCKDEDGDHWWWCVPCMEADDCYATEEEIKRAKKERRSRAK